MIVRMTPPYRFPKACPHCAGPADSMRSVVFRKGGGWAPTGAKYQLDVPYCRGCNARYWLLRGLLFFVPLLLGIGALALMVTGMNGWSLPVRLLVITCFFLGVLSPLFWFLGRRLFSDLKLRDLDPHSRTVELKIGSTRYGTKLRDLNPRPGSSSSLPLARP